MRLNQALMALVLLPILATPAALSQTTSEQTSHTAVTPPTTTAAALQSMASRAGVIFVGRVITIHLPEGYIGSPEDAAEGLVQVRFAIDIPIRGTAPGATQFLLKEWSGLWTDATPRYRVGQRLLVLLHAPSAAGLSSPIDGTDGLLPLTGTGPTPSPEDTTTTPGTLAVDLRWVQTKLLRQPAPIAPSPIQPEPIRPNPVFPEPVLPYPRTPLQGSGRLLARDLITNSQPNHQLVPIPHPRVPWHPAAALTSEAPTAALNDVLTLLRATPPRSQESPQP